MSIGLVERMAGLALGSGVVIEPEVIDRLAEYVGMLFHWNHRINLTGLSWDDKGLERLVVEPLVAVSYLPKKQGGLSIVDIGSGGGSPAIPMKLAASGVGLRMIESKVKKGAFLREVIRRLNLSDTEVLSCRYEELVAQSDFRETADVVTLRAVRIDERSIKHLQKFLRVGGALFLFRNRAEPLPAVSPSLRHYQTCPLVNSLQSSLVVYQKVGE